MLLRATDRCAVPYFLFLTYSSAGARGSVGGSGTMLQAGRSRVRFPMRSLDFSIELTLQADRAIAQAVSR
jgi:hypothetical protein